MSSYNPFHEDVMEAVSLEAVEQNGHNGLASPSLGTNGHDTVEGMKVAVEAPEQSGITPLQIEQHRIEPSGVPLTMIVHRSWQFRT